jgi:hypothetical protein
MRIQGLSRPARMCQARSIWHIISQDLPNCAVCQAIIALELLEADLDEFMQPAYSFSAFG